MVVLKHFVSQPPSLKHLTGRLSQRQGSQQRGDRPAILDPDSNQLPPLEALRAAQTKGHYLDLQISPMTQNVLYFQSQQTQHTDFTRGEPFQALEARTHTKQRQGLRSRVPTPLPRSDPILAPVPHHNLAWSQLKAHYLCPKRSLALYCPLHSTNHISGSYHESPGAVGSVSPQLNPCSASLPWSTPYNNSDPTMPLGGATVWGINPRSFKGRGSQNCPPTHSWSSMAALGVTDLEFARRGYLSGLVLTEIKQNGEKG